MESADPSAMLPKFTLVAAPTALAQTVSPESAEFADNVQLDLLPTAPRLPAFALTRTQSSSMMHSSVLLVLPTQLQIRMPLDASATLVSFCPPTTSVLRTAETQKC